MWLTAALAVAGAIAGGYSYWRSNKKNNESINKQIDYLDTQWQDQQEKALEKAATEDKETTLQEAVLGSEANGALRQLGMQQEADALAYNQAEMNRDAQEGSAYASMAQSGTKNSSALNAVQMASDVSEQQIQMQEDQNRLNEDVSLSNVMNGLLTGGQNLQERRTEASELRNDFSEGGVQYNLWQKQRDMMKDGKTKEWSQDWWAGMASSMFNGASTGANFGSTLQSTIDNWSTQTTKSSTAQADTTATFSLAEDNISGINIDNSTLFNQIQNNFGNFRISTGGLSGVNASIKSTNPFAKSSNRYNFSWSF